MKSIIDNIAEQVSAERSKRFETSDQLSLGEIIDKCEKIQSEIKDEAYVVFDFEYTHPIGLSSWRGSYNELALTWTSEGGAPKLSDFIALLKVADGATYVGWKGGDFVMSRKTPVWVANPGRSGNTAVIDVMNNGYSVIILTAYREF